MTFLLSNLILAIAWAALNGDISAESLMIGLVIGYGFLWLIRGALGAENYTRKVPQVIGFIAYFFYELVKSNLRVAWEVITPDFHMTPGIVAIPLDLHKDLQIVLLANLITLTPGTLSIEVSTDKRVLFVHSMYIPDNDVEQFRASIKNGFERRIKELFS